MKIKLFAVAVLLTAFSALSALAQVGRMEGEVKKRGTNEPIPNAEVQIHRNDIKWSANLKTDKKGKFIHAGIQYGGTYVIIVGADGFAPAFSNGHKPDQPIPAFELDPGDGKRLTFDEVKAAMSKGPGGGAPGAPAGAGANKAAAGPSKKELEEYNKKVEEVKKKNEKIEADNKAMNAALEAGKTAFNTKDYNTAIAEFDKGIALDAEQNVFWYFKGLSLYNRGVTHLNASLQDPSKRDPAKADFTDAITNANKAITLLDAQQKANAGAPDAAKAAQNKTNMVAYMKVRADSASLLGRRFSDPAMAEAANKDYVAIAEMTDDPVQKKKYLFTGAETLRDAGNVDAAVAAYKAIIDLDPNYADAYYGIGLAYFGNEKTFQDGANYLQFFIDKAPATDSRVAEAKGVIDAMKIKPSKDALNALKKEADTKAKAAPARRKN
ncbi:MAG TPA: tetratricopeptide repeat protein [Blastocatellia bacterium]|nr:tetratricopeptide repeat protein [Blastocatellia bacterium]